MLLDLFRKHLITYREARGMTLTALASRAKVAVSYISMLENGQRSPSLETVEALARGLGLTDPRSLFGRPGRS